jgi:hypothetical protein
VYRTHEGDKLAGTGPYDRDGNPVDRSVATPAWTKAARPVLEEVARKYNARVTYGTLATEVQELTGIFTKQPVHYWVGPMAFGCTDPGEPLLCSLVVNAQGLVGDGYQKAVLATYGEPAPGDLQMHSAEERLKCYRHFGADLPTDGGRATLTPQVARTRVKAATTGRDQARRPVCPVHNLEMPLTGRCDLCADVL